MVFRKSLLSTTLRTKKCFFIGVKKHSAMKKPSDAILHFGESKVSSSKMANISRGSSRGHTRWVLAHPCFKIDVSPLDTS
jgi:hypothetical protein